MYDELVERLRAVEKMLTTANFSEASSLISQAADAIEEPSKLADAIPHVCECCVGCELEKKNGGCNHAFVLSQKRAKEYMSKPRWIPVTERLPEDGKFVLVCNDDGKMMIAKHETETYEWYYKYTNYDFDIWDNEEQGPVRYWIPLPEQPKEE